MKHLDKRIVVTGIGVVSPIGIGRENFWNGLENGMMGIKPITRFDVSKLKCKMAGEIVSFDAEKYIGKKGLRYLNRTTRLACSAAKLALDDAKLLIGDRESSSKIGVVIGTTLGAVQSMSDFDIQSLKEGPRYVAPMKFPHTISNAPASQLGIKFGVTGFNTTISSGQTSSLKAVNYGVDFIKLGRSKIVLAGGSEALSYQTYLGFFKSHVLSKTQGTNKDISVPFDKGRDGLFLAEGSSILVLEELEHALSRRANIYAEIIGFGNVHDAYKIGRYKIHSTAAETAIKIAIDDAQIEPGTIGLLCANANGSLLGDRMESKAINTVFKDYAQELPVCSIKSMVGESYSASGAIQIAASILAMHNNIVPPTLSFSEQGEKDSRLKTLSNLKYNRVMNTAMINCFDCNGDNASMVIAKL